MDNKNTAIIVGLLALITGLLLGYGFGGNGMMSRSFFFGDNMFDEMNEHMEEEWEEHRYGDENIDGDGAMIHAMDEMMLGFRGKTGEEYEEAFVRGMIVHHIGAIEMAEELLRQTDRPELVQLANDIIETQSAEVEMMKSWLSGWFGQNR